MTSALGCLSETELNSLLLKVTTIGGYRTLVTRLPELDLIRKSLSFSLVSMVRDNTMQAVGQGVEH